jgi:hypothetical protein
MLTRDAGVLEREPPSDRPDHPDVLTPARDEGRPTGAARVAAACVVLLLVYVVLSFALDVRGTLLADSGGKLATMRVMEERGTLDPDLGYWAAEDDPDGALVPLHYSAPSGDGFVQASTLPMLYAAFPLYDVGGTRAALLLPMTGGVLTALAARALTRRLAGGGTAEWTAFWAVGLATPVVIYSVSFWEHTLGLAAMLWAIVLAMDLVERRGSASRALAAGALFGVAAAMRTEALVYVAVTGVAVLAALVAGRARIRRIVGSAMAALAGMLSVLVANHVLEVVTAGEGRRTGRTSQTAGEVAGEAAQRVKAAATSLFGVNGFTVTLDWIVGALIAVLVVSMTACMCDARPARRRVGVGLLAIVLALYAVRFGADFNYVPGLFVAAPIAVAGLWGVVRLPSARLVAVIATVSIPALWASQYVDSQRFQWGYRFALTSGVLLAVVAVVVLARHRTALVAVLGLSVLVTAYGLTFLAVRSSSIADGMRALVAREDPVLVSMERHLFREGGDFYRIGQRWLTAEDGKELERAASIVASHGYTDLAIVAPDGIAVPERVGPYERDEEVQRIGFRPGEIVLVTAYRRS